MTAWPDDIAGHLERVARIPIEQMGPTSRARVARGELAAERHDLMLDGLDDRWWRWRRRHRRLARLAELETALGMTTRRRSP